jgi:hypothetical protein
VVRSSSRARGASATTPDGLIVAKGPLGAGGDGDRIVVIQSVET